MLRQLFRAEAHDALEAVTSRVLAGGSARAVAETLTEMMRVTHTLKGAAGTVGLDGDGRSVAPARERVRGGRPRAVAVDAATADLIVEVTDGLRALPRPARERSDGGRDAGRPRLRDQIARIAHGRRRASCSEILAPSPQPIRSRSRRRR